MGGVNAKPSSSASVGSCSRTMLSTTMQQATTKILIEKWLFNFSLLVRAGNVENVIVLTSRGEIVQFQYSEYLRDFPLTC